MLGVVLCGGRSTRFEHKLMLCDKATGNNIVVEAGYKLYNAGILNLAFCVSKNESTWLRMMLAHHFECRIVEDDYSGLANVLDPLIAEDDCVVLCGDNIYGPRTAGFLSFVKSNWSRKNIVAAVNTYVKRSDLCGYEELPQRRFTHKEMPCVASLTTPWCIPKGKLIQGRSVIDYFNQECATAHYCNDPYWRDLGNADTVKEYYR